MSNYDIIPVKPNTPEWHKIRQQGLGASDVAAILGMSKWKTPYQIWMQKTGQEGQQEQTQVQLRGLLLEDGIMRWYEIEQETSVNRPQAIYRSKQYPFMQYTPDGICEKDNLIINVQVKSTRIREGWGDFSDEVPDEVNIQSQYEMMISGIEVTHIPVLLPSLEFKLYCIEADKEIQGYIKESCEEFWMNNVQKGIEPELITNEDAKSRYPFSKASIIHGSQVVIEDCQKLKTLKEEIKTLEKEKEEAEARIKSFMGENDTLLFQEKVLATWKSTKARESFDGKLLQQEHPELYKNYVKTGNSYRTFLLK